MTKRLCGRQIKTCGKNNTAKFHVYIYASWHNTEIQNMSHLLCLIAQKKG